MSTTPTSPLDAGGGPHNQHPSDHGVRMFDPELASHDYSAVAQGNFRVLRTRSGRYYATVKLHTPLGHLCAAVHLERAAAEGILSSTGAEVAPALDRLSETAENVNDRLEAAAAARGTDPVVLQSAKLCLRAHMGDEQARDFIARCAQKARRGDQRARKCVAYLATGRRFAHEVLDGGGHTTGNFFSDIGHAISHAVRDVGRAVKSVSHQVMNVVRKAEKVVGPVIKAIKQWGPLILSTIHGIVSLIPGIGTAISAALAAAEAFLSGGGILEMAIHLAYGAIPIPPGIRQITDMVLDAVIQLIKDPKHLVDVGIAAIRGRIPQGLPQQVFDTLVAVVVHHKPILKAGLELAGHYVGNYIGGAVSAVTKGLERYAGTALHAIVSKLPDPKTIFKGIQQIAPHFSISPKMVGTLIEHAKAMCPHISLPPALQAVLHGNIVNAVKAQMHEAATLRAAQHAHVAGIPIPRVGPPGAPLPIAASLSVELNPTGTQQRVVSTAGLAHLVGQFSAGVSLA